MAKKKFSCINVCATLTILAHLVVLVGIGVMLRAGSGPIKNDLPTDAGRYMVLIDTDQYSREINGQTYQGLPDSHDFSKDKDFFGIFPSLYCSGKKKDDKYIVDFCSPWGKQFFDLHRLWRVWGVDLVQDKLVGQAPRQAFIGLLVGAGSTALSIVMGLLAYKFLWCAVVATLGAWIAAITMICTAAFSTLFINKLVSRAPNLKLTGKGKLVVHSGKAFMLTQSVAAAIALACALIWTFVTWRKRSANKKKAAGKHGEVGYVGVIRRTTGDFFGKLSSQNTSYKHLSGESELTALNSRGGSEVDITSNRQLERLGDDNVAYEPMRHRNS
ncbi:hypothetical protein FB567DRAFT_611943 [Paraphoma chrysanthemicola]|uniref:Uncharacterized protein n=1 Tax=Paraphoma chrysanthemicola TaxID=798071 RepID=A0A8K0QWK5_9PLEO|nr:hypothetical protein FB567DRAFT_611943 [Paraphoma chrysanthemicola]